jgi:hypothetical protein
MVLVVIGYGDRVLVGIVMVMRLDALLLVYMLT